MSNDSVAQAVAGAGGGALAMVVTYPLITLSTRAQIERNKSPSSQKSGQKQTIVSAASRIIQREGIGGLYSGIPTALFGISLTNFVYYYFYEGARAAFLHRNRLKNTRKPGDRATSAFSSASMSALESMTAGALAGSVTVVLTNPIWVVNTRQTVGTTGFTSKDGRKQSTIVLVRQMLVNEGPMAFFAGVMPALVLVLNPVLQYTIFERLRAMIQSRRPLKPLDFFVLGAIGKLIATIVTYPYITIKARMQVQKRSSLQSQPSEQIYSSTISALWSIIKNEGWSSLYAGIESKIVQSVLTSAFLFYFKEQLVVASATLLNFIRIRRIRSQVRG
ncbi:mitochondrial carrier domain-containing protein [Lipomyces oligophaga]|uniref:mitochondrial carrier domain-containing protein n=1 Tax=Lipomyces oligophaga TaxID=45792 RepID=UPI0034CFC220